MNLFLLDKAVEEILWPSNDQRTVHIGKTLKAKDGDSLDFGVINGPRGKGMVKWIDGEGVKIVLQWNTQHESDLLPISLLVGLARPQTSRKVLHQAASLGLKEVIFFNADKGEPSYAQSSLWEREWKDLLVKGAEQAFSCHLPNCQKITGIEKSNEFSKLSCKVKIALDIYEAENCLSSVSLEKNASVQLAIGPERGWSAKERDWLRQQGFILCHMGQRVLRQETAFVAAVGCLSHAYWPERGWDGIKTR